MSKHYLVTETQPTVDKVLWLKNMERIMRTNTVTGVIFGLLMVFSVSSQADGIEDALREHTPNKKVGEHIEGSGSMSSNNIDECEQRVQETGLGNLLGAEIRYLQVTGGKCYYYGPGSSMGQGGDEVYEYSRDYGSIRQVENTTTNTNVTDNSIQMSSNVNSNIQVDSSMNISTTDNSSVQNINSSTDTYNVDNSQVINNISSNTTNKLIQSCGMTLEQAHAVVDIVKYEAAKTNMDASNTFVVTGNSNTITDVRLESEVDFEGGDIDKSCVLHAVNDMQNDLEN